MRILRKWFIVNEYTVDRHSGNQIRKSKGAITGERWQRIAAPFVVLAMILLLIAIWMPSTDTGNKIAGSALVFGIPALLILLFATVTRSDSY